MSTDLKTMTFKQFIVTYQEDDDVDLEDVKELLLEEGWPE